MRKQTKQELQSLLRRLDGAGYKAYKQIRGAYEFRDFTLYIDYVQGDPFAAPSRVRVRVPQQYARYPESSYQTKSRRIGLENYLLLALAQAAKRYSARKGSGKSGLIFVDAPGQVMLARTALQVDADFVEAQFAVGLPAQGRRVLGQAATQLLCVALPRLVTAALLYENNDPAQITAFAQTAEDADALRVQLAAAGLVAFVADGSILPRRSGVDERPLPGKAVVRWQSPPERQVSFTLPNAGEISGMGVPAGVTLIVGGGFHGKSTLLNALQHGVYNHRPHDGRERVVTVESAVKIRAEDGRFVCGVDISPFINNLPFGRQTEAFHSENASGSTSQAANIMEALAIGTELLLIDEDTAATNFMIRDRRMQALIAKEQEPITPFIDRVRQLYDEHGISTILVMGGSGDYFDVADQVISMSAYRAYERTAAAKAISAQFDTARTVETSGPFGALRPRLPQPGSLNARKGKRARYMKVHDRHTIQFGTERIDLSQVAQLVDRGQTRAIAGALLYARERYMDGKRPLREICRLVMADIEREGLGVLNGRPGNDYAQFRPYELAAALNRLRSLRVNNP